MLVKCPARFGFTMTLSWLAVAACHDQRPSVDPTVAAAYSRDSAKFVRDSIRWARAPIVIDSISRTINTDSLYRLYRTFIAAENPVPVWGAILCETVRLSRTYGSLPAHAAEDRMLDTTFHPADKVSRERAEHRLRIMTPEEALSVTMGARTCGRRIFEESRTELDGIPLDQPVERPVKPKRP